VGREESRKFKTLAVILRASTSDEAYKKVYKELGNG